ncbi:hypothetical protein SDC9_82313 [bioreactor metagenome]|uniref:Schlafen AlbA-2 domain-containing protein n=1 Tax=bioreactor metagenome TaxID=1076179 RepID=A0A644Z4A3_9ZZZZ
MQNFENLDVEYKEIYVPEIKKEVIAFANTEGGTLYIGIRRDGFVVGVEDADAVMLQVASALKDAIKPDIIPFVRIKAIQREEKIVVEIGVQVGTNRPYYLQEKGLKPSGVYVRRGSASQPLSDDGIREMIIQNSGRTYEDARSLNQELSFEYFQKEMVARSLESGTMQMRTLHMLGEDGLFTNLALLLSDQCEHTMKVAIFQGIDKTVFRDRKEFTGSLFKQLEDVYQFIDLNNRTKAIFSGLNRVDKRDYPEDAIREALLNSITHREYSFSGSTLINLYDDRIEFVSLGGLVPGLSMEAIFMGVSQSRNPHLAGILYRMRLIESYGTGIRKILRLYHDEMSKAKFETAEGAFRVTLFNRNATYSPETQPAAQNEKDIIFEYALEQGGITRKEAEELIGAGTTKAFRLLKELCSEGKMYTEGNGKQSKYIPN